MRDNWSWSMKLILITGILIVMIFTPKDILGAKMVILSFDDSTFGQYIVAKPILDKYGFKGTVLYSLQFYWENWSYELDSDKYPTKRRSRY